MKDRGDHAAGGVARRRRDGFRVNDHRAGRIAFTVVEASRNIRGEPTHARSRGDPSAGTRDPELDLKSNRGIHRHALGRACVDRGWMGVGGDHDASGFRRSRWNREGSVDADPIDGRLPGRWWNFASNAALEAAALVAAWSVGGGRLGGHLALAAAGSAGHLDRRVVGSPCRGRALPLAAAEGEPQHREEPQQRMDASKSSHGSAGSWKVRPNEVRIVAPSRRSSEAEGDSRRTPRPRQPRPETTASTSIHRHHARNASDPCPRSRVRPGGDRVARAAARSG